MYIIWVHGIIVLAKIQSLFFWQFGFISVNLLHFYRSGGSGRILPGADGGWSSGGGAGPMQPQQKEWSSGKLLSYCFRYMDTHMD